ncbi:MAG: Sjogren's syndrome/scleroderma autoantigen 1 family protein [Candidatus Methanoperedens sp.]|nr:hypothetical protein [Candidatus Methanoperedens sp.]
MSGKEDEKIQKITKLLERGGTMLASHHECGAPMFRYQGKTVCPVCDFQEEEKKADQGHKKDKKEPEPPSSLKPQAAQEGEYQTINRIISNKIHAVAMNLEAETDLARVKDRMECIERGIRILKLLKEEKEG